MQYQERGGGTRKKRQRRGKSGNEGETDKTTNKGRLGLVVEKRRGSAARLLNEQNILKPEGMTQRCSPVGGENPVAVFHGYYKMPEARSSTRRNGISHGGGRRANPMERKREERQGRGKTRPLSEL